MLLPERADPYADEMKRIAEEQKARAAAEKEAAKAAEEQAREAGKARQAAEKPRWPRKTTPRRRSIAARSA